MADQADRLLELAAPGAAEYDQECDSYSDCDIYMDGGDGIDAYCGVERCGNCQQKRLSAVFPNTVLQSGIQDIYYSDWVPAMIETQQQALSDIMAQTLDDAYQHARKTGKTAASA